MIMYILLLSNNQLNNRILTSVKYGIVDKIYAFFGSVNNCEDKRIGDFVPEIGEERVFRISNISIDAGFL